ncbi:WD40 repeat-like protein [Phanerochaete sordida]|uniref:WD40 repeat-like protein n=1 Tax=Phanerochaete sordida TaxID=48140 RepID=A0A9P3LEK9_9APHY|nr:WD40 repeat-like protein [Phanerochaete sordida]
MTVQLSLTLADDPQSSIQTSFSQAVPSCILPLRKDDVGGSSVAPETLGGAIVGCEDGSLYLFHSRKAPARALSVDPFTRKRESPHPPSSAASSVPATPRHLRRGVRSPRSSSPASLNSLKSPTFSPFHVSKPTVVSSVSTEQVEAPKNYVDFEDEQEKLKGLLRKKGGVKDRTVVDALLPTGDKVKPLGPDKCTHSDSLDTTPSEPPSNQDLVTPRSSSASEESLSTPSTPSIPSAFHAADASEPATWSLISHSFPTCNGLPSTVTSLKAAPGLPLAVALLEAGAVNAYATEDGCCVATSPIETESLTTSTSTKIPSKLPVIWHWRHLHVAPLSSSTLVLACASSEATTSTIQLHDLETGERTEESRLVAFALHMARHADPGSASLTKLGDWTLAGPAEGVALHAGASGQITLVHVDAAHHVVRQTLALAEGPPTPSADPDESSSQLALPNPFKALKGLRSSENLVAETKNEDTGRVLLTDTLDLGLLPLGVPLQPLRVLESEALSLALAWTHEELVVFDIGGMAVSKLGATGVQGICDVHWTERDSLTIAFKDRAEVYDLVEVDANNDSVSDEQPVAGAKTLDFRIRRSAAYSPTRLCALTASGDVLAARAKNGRLRLQATALAGAADAGTRVVWKPRRDAVEKGLSGSRVTAVLSLGLDEMFVGLSDGIVSRCSFSQLVLGAARSQYSTPSDIPLRGRICSLHATWNERTGENLVVGGADDGSVAVWSRSTLKLLACWTIFTEPLAEVLHIASGRLKECIFCISRDGTIAVVSLDGYEFLYLIPASVAPLRKICLGEDNLLLVYGDGRARLWDTRTREFWRSMGADKTEDMLRQGGWTEWTIPLAAEDGPQDVFAVAGYDHLPDAGATLVVDVEAFLTQVAAAAAARAAEASASAAAAFRKEALTALLAGLLTFGVSDEIDRICRERLGVSGAVGGAGAYSHGSATVFADAKAQGAWAVSSLVSATRATAIMSVLQVLAQQIDDAHTVSAFYTASLAHAIGHVYKAPNLAWLGRTWLHSSHAEVRSAARLRFEVGIARLQDEEILEVVDSWQSSLPSLQLGPVTESTQSALALFICGNIAIEKYSLLHTTSLTDIAKSIATYLHDEHCPYRVLAIDLCSRGFPVWQQYVDAVEMLRALFALATASRKDSSATQPGAGTQARSAVLHIAAGNSPLFMTTVSMDILHPKSVQHRKSVMALVIFLIHKKPLVLYSNLPRLVEAVVKSLDPNSTADRDAVLDSATEILGHIVDSYPTVDFHGPSQRLAVGTSEGAVVMYDLKTATRLYVLEGHKKRTTACSFSPDGRRLVTLCLEEFTLLVWKVGTSFTSFFLPGAPPRQGHSGSEPYKTYPVHIGEDGVMTIANTLDLIKFEWPSDRSVRLMIREVTLTFST